VSQTLRGLCALDARRGGLEAAVGRERGVRHLVAVPVSVIDRVAFAMFQNVTPRSRGRISWRPSGGEAHVVDVVG
jgi:hypothetical protein